MQEMSKKVYIGVVMVVSFLVSWQSYSIHKAKSISTLFVTPTVEVPMEPPQKKFSFLFDEAHKCMGRTPFLLLLIPSIPEEAATRDVIRKTWGNETLMPGVDIMRMFLLGAPQPPAVFAAKQALLRNESATFGDIIQQDFMDTYNNLTLKTTMGMEWVATYCPNATYVMKIDSDMFFNPLFLVNHLLQPNLPAKKNYFTGAVIRWARPFRNQKSKWFVSSDVYPKDVYPTYCSGTGYVLSGDLAAKIYHIAPQVTPINMEDVFMGLCLEKLQIQIANSPNSIFNINRIGYERCKFTKLITVHHYTKEDIEHLWPDFVDALKSC
ncbi:beta-1,3-galactosyltransferase 2-like [Lissotriton helveticus]